VIPRSELCLHRALVLQAVGMALDGDAADGYTFLLEAAWRVSKLEDAGWREELRSRYHRSLDEYAERFQVARG
jgi:hypothetical protein